MCDYEDSSPVDASSETLRRADGGVNDFDAELNFRRCFYFLINAEVSAMRWNMYFVQWWDVNDRISILFHLKLYGKGSILARIVHTVRAEVMVLQAVVKYTMSQNETHCIQVNYERIKGVKAWL